MDVNDAFDSATESTKKRELPKPPGVSKETSRGKNTGSSGPDPTNRMDEDLSSEEIDEQIPAEEGIVDSSGKSSYHFFNFILACN